MIRGHIDALTAGGFAEGWAYNQAAEDAVVAVRVVAPDGAELGRGLANLYRGDLSEIGYRQGWCAFRLCLSRTPEQLRGARLALRDVATDSEICATDAWRLRNVADPACDSVEAVIQQDPTVLRSILHLQGGAEAIARFVARHGVADFIRTAYAYVLGRPADAAGLAGYERMLRIGALTPFGLLLHLAESNEFRERPRLLASPADPGYIFAG